MGPGEAIEFKVRGAEVSSDSAVLEGRKAAFPEWLKTFLRLRIMAGVFDLRNKRVESFTRESDLLAADDTDSDEVSEN